MKNILLAAAVIMMCFVGIFAADVTDSYKGTAVVSGHGDVLPEGVRVRLLKLEDGHYDFVATDTIANGQFKLELAVEDGLTIAVIMFDYYAFPSMVHKLYLTPGAKVEIDAIDNYTFTWPVKSSVPEQAEYDLYINNSKDLWTEIQKAKIEYEKSGKYDVYTQKNDSLRPLIYLRDLELLKTRPFGTVWMDKAIEFAQYGKITSEDMNALYANLNDSIKKSPKGKALHGYLYPGSHIRIGDRIPDTEFHDLEGNAHVFSEFQGKWCLVDFWNSGCSACIRAIPELRELKKIYPETLELVSLSIDTENMWHKSSEIFHLTGNNWNEGKENYGIYRRLGTGVLPTFVLISPNGTIKDIWVGYDTGRLKQKMSTIIDTDVDSTKPCLDSPSSSSDGTLEIVESIPIHQIDGQMNVLEVYNMGNFLAWKEVPYSTVICNFDSVRGVRITGIDGDSLVSECNASRDSIEPGMLISVVFRLSVPEEKGPFDALMRIHYKDVKNPSIIKLHGNAE